MSNDDPEYWQMIADAVNEGRVKPPSDSAPSGPQPRDPGWPPGSSYAENRRMWRNCCLLVPVVCIAVLAILFATGWIENNWNYWLATAGLF